MNNNSVRDILFANRFTGYPGYRLKKFIERISRKLEKGSVFLDAGAGECQYKEYFTHVKYISQDSCVGDDEWDYSKIDIRSEVYDMPLKDQSVDSILCIEVLEHLKFPDRAFREFQRIMRPGGRLFVVCPFFWQEHQKPHDYFRYTQFAMKMLGDRNGFKVEAIEKQGGKFVVLMELINGIVPAFFMERGLKKIGRFSQLLLYPIHFPLGILLFFLDKLDKSKDITAQYECVYIKVK